MSFVEIKDVVKRYGSRISVDHLNLNIEEGEVLGLLGPNGAGKSTTIGMICGLIGIDSGGIRVGGLSVKESPMEVKRMLGLVPQDLALYEKLPAEENVMFFARLHGLRGSLLKQSVKEALEFVGLEDKARELPATFSGGMKRRLNIACAIMHRPKLVIMDEPTVGIDPQSRNHILEAVRELNRAGSTVIYTSHYMEEVEAVSSRVAIIDRGHLIASGTQSELRERAAQQERILLQVTPVTEELLKELKEHPRIEAVEADGDRITLYLSSAQRSLQDVLFICARHEALIGSLECEAPNLESLFLNLTGRTLRD
ncbi:ABC transporter ATP-binding protein [Saccharibacillus deserti]|uniref:ABC transporter ATP-binding protein n=1 Tax=Saccharibacillus deserti TaxID=1634444 RepID=UPI001556AA64|nr:ABC transporter ATP-binding protein [Saccharibacillus deserti]